MKGEWIRGPGLCEWTNVNTGEISSIIPVPDDAYEYEPMRPDVFDTIEGSLPQGFVTPTWDQVLASGRTGTTGLMAPIWERWKDCNLCRLCEQRRQVVLGSGNPTNPKYVLIGEGPGATEDQEGTPFVGRTGQLLTQVLNKFEIDRVNDCYLMNAVSCWPPGNRNPEREEIHACNKRLWQQLSTLAKTAKVIVLIGKPAYASVMHWNQLSNESFNIDSIRIGRMLGWVEQDFFPHDPKIYTVYHPSYIARRGIGTPEHAAWEQDWEAISYYGEQGVLMNPRGGR